MRIADRIAHLGTETAFAVSGEAAEFAAAGNEVFPFHLGDLDLPTPSTVVDGAWKALRDGKTGYAPNAGIPQLREALAADVASARGVEYAMENVAVQPGGKPTIGKFFLSLLNPGDEVLYPNPGYPIYQSQIEFNGGIAVPYGYVEGASNFEIDFDSLERGITDKTRLLVLNDLQNPTGADCSLAEHEHLAEIVRNHDLYVLVDEAYFEMRYSGKTTSFVSQPGMAERSVILYTFSKKYAMTGWRLGASIGPKEVIDVIAKINTNDESCANHFVQYGGLAGLVGDQSEPRAIVDELRRRRDVAVAGLNAIEGVECFTPNATFYLFPNVTAAMRNTGIMDYEEFRRAALHATGVSFTNRLHFGTAEEGETQRYARFAYSGITVDRIEEGIARFKEFCET
jgi:aspartate/methionine/tyrosine aminotransferase